MLKKLSLNNGMLVLISFQLQLILGFLIAAFAQYTSFGNFVGAFIVSLTFLILPILIGTKNAKHNPDISKQ